MQNKDDRNTLLAECPARAPANADSIREFGGKYIVRAGAVVPVEGDEPKGRFVVIEFPSLAVAKRFESSPEYRAIAPLRQKAARTRLFLVEGVANDSAGVP